MTKTILIVDDKISVRKLLKEYLGEHNFRTVTASNGQEALFTARREKPDLILLDIMMPEMDGYEFIRLHRQEANTPIILLTAKLEETDKVLGLELGADDYVTKPFGMRELLARIRSVLRRVDNNTTAVDILRIGDISLDRSSREVQVSGNSVHLTPSEFELMALMMATPGRVFPRLELLEELQGTSFEGAARTVDVHIRNLRTKIETDPSNPRYIETVFGIGYRFHAGNTKHRS
jgi:DNA-binding response OmpR family regulator